MPQETDIINFVKEKGMLLHFGIIKMGSLKKIIPSITYRKINAWDKIGLLPCSRARVSGWRSFSFTDIVKIQIISDLRSFGFDTEAIKTVLAALVGKFYFEIDKKEPKHIKNCFEYLVFATMLGEKTLLLIKERSNIKFYSENKLIRTHFLAEGDSTPLLVLPFHNYINKIVNSVDHAVSFNPKSTIKSLANEMSDKEKKILDIIRNKSYVSLSISKTDGSNLVLRATSRQKGSFSDTDVVDAINKQNYQKVTAVKLGGKTVSITREETTKI